MEMKVLFDGDPGIDDAIAILVAALSRRCKLVAVTTVAGNVPLKYSSKNALRIMELLPPRKRVPVSEGASKPILRDLTYSFHIHGSDGLGNIRLPEPILNPRPKKAVDQILSMTDKYMSELIIVAAGPLTNLALTFLKDLEMMRKVGHIVVMGGAIRSPGNVTASAEFNIYSDPEAAKIVFNSGLPITLVSLDVSTDKRNLFTEQDICELFDYGSQISKVAYWMLKFYIDAYDHHKGVKGCFIHDALAMLIATNRELVINEEKIRVEVETKDEVNIGRTEADLLASTLKANVTHPIEINYLKAKEELLEILKI